MFARNSFGTCEIFGIGYFPKFITFVNDLMPLIVYVLLIILPYRSNMGKISESIPNLHVINFGIYKILGILYFSKLQPCIDGVTRLLPHYLFIL